MEYVNKILRFLYADEMRAQALETNYLLFDYKPVNDDEKKIIDKAR